MKSRKSIHRRLGFLCLLAALAAIRAHAVGETYTVTNTNDSGAGSLREAMNLANATTGAHIEFNIGGGGAQTITVTSGLPTITANGTVVGGSTQPGYAGTPLVRVDGNGGSYDGIVIQAANCTVKALMVTRFGQLKAGIRITGAAATGNKVEGCYVGTDGTNALGSGEGVRLDSGAQGNTIGGTAAGARNTIGRNRYGVYITGAGTASNVVMGNTIGTNAAGAVLGNTYGGVCIQSGAQDNTIGGTALGAGNTIARNYGGIGVDGTLTTGNRLQRNSIYANTTYGIRLTSSGNGGVAWPAVTGAVLSGGNLVFAGTCATGATLEFFLAESSGSNQGKTFLASFVEGSVDDANAAAGSFTFAVAGGGGVTIANYITATQMDTGGNTSHFSVNVWANDLCVTTTADSGAGSLREVINAANALPGSRITFAIGTGAKTISLSSSLPSITADGTVIDGTTQPGYAGTPLIRVDGYGLGCDGITIAAANCTVKALMVTRFAGSNKAGIRITGAAATGNKVEGCYLGTDGVNALGSCDGVVLTSGAHGNTIGGTAVGAGNTIGKNTGPAPLGDGVRIIGADNNVVQGNFIGTNAAGANLANASSGVCIASGAQGNTIGGTAAGAGNTIGKNRLGVFITGAGTTNNVVQGNTIGTNAAGANLGNTYDGVFITSGPQDNTIGGAAVGAGNTIARNGTGIQVAGATTTANRLQRNSVYANTTAGISLTYSGNGGIAAPVVTAAILSGANVVFKGTCATGATLEFFLAESSGSNQGKTFIASLVEGSGDDANATEGSFTFLVAGGGGVTAADTVTATQTDTSGNTGAFSANAQTATTVVSTTADSGAGSLRAAINAANAVPGSTITFQIGTGAKTITVASALPAITANGTVIDGTTQPGYHSAIGPLIRVDGGGGDLDGIAIQAADCTVKALMVTQFSQPTRIGIVITGAGSTGNKVEGCYLGTDGTNDLGNSVGVKLTSGAQGNTIGGTATGAGNTIGGNDYGIHIGGPGNVVQGNFIGTNAAGASLGNTNQGVYIWGVAGNTIGGTAPGAGNTIGKNGAGIYIGGGGAGNVVQGNYIGTNAAGASLGNSNQGVSLGVALGNTIGGTAAGAGNTIGKNASGIYITGSGTNDNVVQGNFIGTNAAGASLGNTNQGVYLLNGAQGNTIGGTAAGAGNTIARNPTGIRVDGATTTGNRLQRNSVYANTTTGISLTNSGNGGTAAPVVTAAVLTGGNLVLTGTCASGATLEFLLAESSGSNQGKTFKVSFLEGSEHDANAAAGAFAFTLAGTWGVTATDYVTATQTDASGNTGPFSANAHAGGPYVTTAADSGDGSLREAINLANAVPGSTITFQIGTGPQTITVASALPAITANGTVIDGTTQPGYNPANPPLIRVDGNGGDLDGITIQAANCTVKALMVTRFSQPNKSGVRIAGAAATGNRIMGCYVGTDGTAALGNGFGVWVGSRAQGNTVGGTLAGAGNTIGANSLNGVCIYDGDNNLVQGNFIGTNAAGANLGNIAGGISISYGQGNTIGGTAAGAGNTIGENNEGINIGSTCNNVVQGNYIGTNAAGASLGNLAGGICIQTGAHDNTIGGTAAGAGNTIGKNTYGIYIAWSGTNDNVVQGNYIGTNAAGAGLGNTNQGVYLLNGAQGNTIGGTAAGAGNTIARNPTGIRVDGTTTTGNRLQRNSIYANTTTGISLTNSGNGGIAAPAFTTAYLAGGNLTVAGTCPSGAEVDVFAPVSAASPQGKTYLGTVTDNGAGDANAAAGAFSYTLSAGSLAAAAGITGTATDASGNTSAFPAAARVVVGPAAALQFAQQPTDTAPGAAITPAVTVKVVDSGGATVPVALDVAVALDSGPAGGVLAGTLSRASAAGIATFGDLSLAKAGTYALRATATGLTQGTSASFDITGAAPDAGTSTVAAAPANVTADGSAAATVTVTVKDPYGNPVPGKAVSVAATGTGNALSAPAATDANGQTTCTLKSTKAEAKTVSAVVDPSGVAVAIAQQAAVTFAAGAATAITVASGSGQTGVVGQALANPCVVLVRDANGNPVPNAAVAFTVMQGGGSLSAAGATTNAAGQAQVTLSPGATAGANRVKAEIAGPVFVEFTATGVAGTSNKILLSSGGGQSAAAGTALAEPLKVRVLDANDNPVAGYAVNFVITAGGGGLVSSDTTTDATGYAQAVVRLGPVAGTSTVEARGNGLIGSPILFTATGTAGAAAKIEYASGTNQAAVAGSALASPFVVTVRDAAGNPVQGTAVSFVPTAGGGSLSAPSSATNASGQAQSTLTVGATAGENTVEARVTGLAGSPVIFNARGTVGAPASIAIASGGSQAGTAGTALAEPLVVVVRDANANPVQGVNVTFARTQGNGSLSATSVTTDIAGRAQTMLTLDAAVGTNKVKAEIPGPFCVEFTASGAVGAPYKILAGSGSGQTGVAGASLAGDFVATVRDINHNPVPEHTVTFTVASGGGSLSAGTGVTDASGNAAVRLTLGTTAGTNTVEARGSIGLVGAPALFTATGTPGAAASIARVSGDAQTGVVSEVLAAPLVVVVRDANSNPVPGVAVTFTPQTGGGSPSSSPVSTDAQGQAQTAYTLGAGVGGNSVEAAAAGVGSAITFTATGVSGTSSKILPTSGGGQSAVAGAVLANPLRIQVLDATNNPLAGYPVNFVVTAGGGGLVSSDVATDAGGYAQATLRVGATAGTNRVEARGAGLNGSPITFTATGTAGAAAKIEYTTGTNQTAASGSALPSPFVVTVRDANGNPVEGAAVSFVVMAGGGSLSAGSPTTNASGQVQSVLTLGKTAGTNTVEARAEGLSGSPVIFNAAGMVGAAASISIASGGGQTGTAGMALAEPFVVLVRDANGNAVQGVSVAFTRTQGNGSLSAASATTDIAGRAQTVLTLDAVAGANKVKAEIAGPFSVEFTAAGAVGAPHRILATSGSGQTGLAGSQLTGDFVATVRDINDNPVVGHTVTFTVASGGGSLSAGTAVTDASGNAAVRLTLGTTSGTNTVEARGSIGLVGAPATFTATGTPGAAASIAKVSGDAQTGVAGQALPAPLVVVVQDANGNRVPGVAVTFTRTAGAGSPATTTTSTDAQGQAQVTYTLDAAMGANSVRADAAGVPGTVTFSAAGVAGSSNRILLATGDGQSGVAGAALASPLKVRVLDANSNPVAGYAVNFVVTGGGGGLVNSDTATDANGYAQATLTLGTVAGSNTVEARGTGLSGSPVTFTATGAAGAAARIEYTSGTNQTAVAGTALPNSFVVTVRDANGNPVEGAAVEFVPTAGGGSMAPASTTTNGSGQVQSKLTLGTTAGGNTVEARAAGLTGSPVVFNAAGVVGAAASIGKVFGDTQTGVAGTALAEPFVVVVRDANGNPVPGLTVAFSVTQGNGTLSATSGATNSDGQAQTILTLGATAGANGVRAHIGSYTADFTATGNVGAPYRIALLSGNSQSAVAGSSLANDFVVKVTDINNNPVAGHAVAFAITSGGGSLSTASVATDAAGCAATRLTLGTTMGANVAEARGSVGLVGAPVTFTATGAAGTAASIAIASGDGQTGVAGQALASPFVAVVRDANGNPVQGVGVAFTRTSGAGTPATGTANTDAAGHAQLAYTLDVAVGANKVAASAAGVAGSVTFTATGVAGASSRIELSSGDGQSGTAGSVAASPLKVRVLDTNGNPVAGYAVSFVVTAGGGGLVDFSTGTDADGYAQASLRLGAAAGENRVEARAEGLIGSPTVFTAAGAAGAAAKIELAGGNNQTGVAGSALADPFVATVRDANGNPVANNAVSFVVTTGGGAVSAADVATDASGQARTTLTLGAAAGPNAVEARGAGLAGSPVVFAATGVAAAVGRLALVSGNNQTGAAGAMLPGAFVVSAADQNGNPVAGFTVSFAVTAGGGSLSSSTAVTDALGQAQVTLTLGNAVGTNAVEARGAGLDGLPVTFTATGTSGSAAKLALVSGDGQTGTAGSALARPLVVSVSDANGNPVAGRTVAFAATAGGGALSAATAATNAQGQAQTALTLGTAAGVNTVAAAVDGLAGSPVTFTATGTVGSASRVALVSGNNQAGAAGSALADPFVVNVTDANGNPVAGRAVTFAVAVGGGTLSATNATTDAQGRAQATLTLGTTAGANTVTASADGLAGSPVAFTATGMAAAVPAKLAFLVEPSAVAAGAAIAPAVKVAVQDANGNTILSAATGITLLVGDNPAGGSLSGTATVAAEAGVATFADLNITKPGKAYTLTASAEGLPATASAAFDVTNRAPAVPEILSPAAGAVVSLAPSFRAKVTDADGDRVKAVVDATRGDVTRHWESDLVASGTEVTLSVPADSPLAAGEWSWRVWAVDAVGAVGAAAASRRIDCNRVPGVPELLSPAEDDATSTTPAFRLKAADADGDRVRLVVEVTQGSAVRTYETCLAESGAEGVCEVPGSEALAVGEWSWRAKAVDANGFESAWSASLTAAVMDTPLSDPTQIPEDGLVTFGVPVASAPATPAELGLTGVRLAVWDAATQQYVMDGQVQQIAPGQGMWILSSGAVGVHVSGRPPQDAFPIALYPGWNLISSPFPAAVPWDSQAIRVRKDGVEKSLAEARAAAWAEDWAWAYDAAAGRYDLVIDPTALAGFASEMRPWRAYWVLAHERCDLVLPVPGLRADRSRQRQVLRAWSLCILARAGRKSGSVTLGLAGGGSARATGLAPEPPMGKGTLRMSVAGGAGPLAVDVRHGLSSSQEWAVDVGGGQATAGEDVTLTWPDLRLVPKDVTLRLVDEATGASRSLRTAGSYVFRADGEGVRRLHVVARPRTGAGVLITGMEMAATRGSTRSVRFTLSREASVDVEVLSPTGAMVAPVARGRASTAGINEVPWRSEARAGIYLLRVTATTEDGQRMQASRPVALIR